MGKRSKRPGRAAPDVHTAILAHAATLNAAERFGVRDASEFPEIAELLEASRAALTAGIPCFAYFKGRNYWLRVRLTAQFDIYANSGDSQPLVQGMSISTEGHGHAPGH